MTYLDIGLDLVLIAVWGYVFWLILKISEESYGDTLTSAMPYFIGGYGLFFVLVLVQTLQQHIILGNEPSMTFVFSLQLIQIVAGVMLVKGMIKTYDLTFATEGFFEEDDIE